ncbi:MAG: MMPL family transporter [Lachnospiraceae bacterium]|nr:MMPL family transporter [Lachnospiraceae bacterium]
MEVEEQKPSALVKIAAFIVDKRNLFFLIFGIAVIFSLFSSKWVKVENELAAFLPESFETNRGLTLMEDQFLTYGSAEVMVENISYDDAEALAELIEKQDYIYMVQFNNDTDHYNDFSALFSVTFSYVDSDERCYEAMESLRALLSDHETYISSAIGNSSSETIEAEMQVITVWVAVVVVTVLILTSSSFAEVPVLILTFLVSSALASGTNFMCGTISFVSDSVTIVLQLALSVDYAVILSNRYKEEHKTKESREACIIALSKAIPEIASSSLTTIGGLVAMMFMQFGIGPDMAIVLVKAILFSLLTVFLLMPGIIMAFSKLMDKTTHKSFIPQIPFVGKFAYVSRYIMPFIFIVLILVGYRLSSKCPYVYGYSLLTTPTQSEAQMIDKKIDATFGGKNMVALVVPGNDYEKEARLLKRLDTYPEIKASTGLANTEAMKGRMLTEKLNAREFAEMLDVDRDVAELLYAAYAIDDENYAKLITGVSEYSVPFIDMFDFLYKEIQEGYVTLDDDMMDTIESAHTQIQVAKDQLQGTDYDRMLVYLDLPEEGDETRSFLDELHDIMHDIYGNDADVLVTGEATSQYDLFRTFKRDNTVVSIVSMLVVLVVLLFTFKSAGMPVLLIMVIEGCIWMNFSFPTIMDKPIFFIGYLIVSSIQMGANIDYAIVVSSRYQEVKRIMPQKEAIIDSMNFAFPTIVTSGTMMAVAGILIGQLTSDPCICGIGQSLGRGTIISIITVLFVLPQILLLGDKIIDRTSFDVNLSLPVQSHEMTGLVRVDGVVRGAIDGSFVGTMHGVIRGSVNVQMMTGSMEPTDSFDISHAIEADSVQEDTAATTEQEGDDPDA